MDRTGINKFVIIGYGRTRSNFLKNLLNRQPTIACQEEIFGHDFLDEKKINEFRSLSVDGGDKFMDLLEVQELRKNNPVEYIDYIYSLLAGNCNTVGFKFFPHQNEEAFDHILDNKEIKKIVLIRNFLFSFVSLEQAELTNEWILLEGQTGSHPMITFQLEKFLDYIAARISYLKRIFNILEKSGQNYLVCYSEDVGSDEWWREVLDFLGISERKQAELKMRVQNPKYLVERVSNYREMSCQLTGTEYSFLLYGDFLPDRQKFIDTFILEDSSKLSYFSRQNEFLVNTNESLMNQAKTRNNILREFRERLKRIRKWETPRATLQEKKTRLPGLMKQNSLLINKFSLLENDVFYITGNNLTRYTGVLMALFKTNESKGQVKTKHL